MTSASNGSPLEDMMLWKGLRGGGGVPGGFIVPFFQSRGQLLGTRIKM